MKTPALSLDGKSILFALIISTGSIPTAQAQRPLGIDVSAYQGSAQNPPTSINWASVPSSIVFGWAKATESTGGVDSDFVYNVTQAKAHGVAIGSYHFAHPNLNAPSSESSHYWSTAGAYTKADGLTFMPMLDMEVFTGIVGASSYTDWAGQWCSNIVSAASANSVFLKPCIYVSACHAGNFNTGISRWYSDIANYGVNGQANPQTGTPWTACTGDEEWGSGVWAVWQYQSVGSITGIKGNVDCDVVNGTTTTMQNYIATGPTGTPAPGNVTLYWDPSNHHATPGGGGSGNWGTNFPNWFYTGSSNYSWSTSYATPIFAGSAGTVTMTTPVKVTSLTFNTVNYNISGTSAITMTNAPSLITVPSSPIPETISCPMAGGSYIVTGGGVLVLNNSANSMTGSVIVSNNTTVQLAVAHALGATPMSVTLSNGAVLQNNDLTANDTFILLGANIAIPSGSASLSDSSGAILSLASVISGAGDVIKTGFGKIFLNGASTFTGAMNINQGVLAFGLTGSFNQTTSISLAAGTTFDVSVLSGWTFPTNASFQAKGTGTLAGITAATLKGSAANGVNMGSQPITFVFTPTSSSGDSAHPSLDVTQGALTLNSNLITISNAAAFPLGVGTYTLITQATNGIVGAPNLTPVITGSGLADGTVGSLTVSGGQLNLVVSANSTPVTIDSPTMRDDGTVQLNFSGTPGSSYIIESATDLTPPIAWTYLSTNTADTNGDFSFIDETASNYTSRYYRTLVQQ